MSNKQTDNNKSKFSLSGIIRNNRILMVLSLLISFGLWIWVSVEKSPVVQTVIADVPVNLDLTGSVPEQLSLQIFGDKDFKVDVTVSGKKYILASLDKADITVTAVTNYVDSSGTKTLQLKYAVADGSEDFDIISLSKSYIEVYFDMPKQVELPLEAEFTNDINTLIPENCILGDIVFSKQTITVNGPATEINRISKAVAKANITEKLEKNTTLVPEIMLVAEDGSDFVYSEIDAESKDITMSIPILQKVTLPASVTFKNAPANFVSNPLKYSVYPKTVTAAVPIDLAPTMKSISVATIDFADISGGLNTFNVSSSEIDGIMAIPETASKFRVTVDASGMATKTVTVSAAETKIVNADTNYDVKITDNRDMVFTVIGDEDTIKNINSENISLIADLQGSAINENTNSAVAVASVSSGKCWVCGKNDIKISVTKKAD